MFLQHITTNRYCYFNSATGRCVMCTFKQHCSSLVEYNSVVTSPMVRLGPQYGSKTGNIGLNCEGKNNELFYCHYHRYCIVHNWAAGIAKLKNKLNKFHLGILSTSCNRRYSLEKNSISLSPCCSQEYYPLYEYKLLTAIQVTARNTGYCQEYKVLTGIQVTARSTSYCQEYKVLLGFQVTARNTSYCLKYKLLTAIQVTARKTRQCQEYKLRLGIQVTAWNTSYC